MLIAISMVITESFCSLYFTVNDLDDHDPSDLNAISNDVMQFVAYVSRTFSEIRLCLLKQNDSSIATRDGKRPKIIFIENTGIWLMMHLKYCRIN